MSDLPSPSREEIYSALFQRGVGLTWSGGQSFQFASRRLKLWADVPAQPAFCQAEYTEAISQASNQPYKRRLPAWWFIYHSAGKDDDAIPAQTNNAIMDAVEAALAPLPTDPGFPDPRNTLGGLVYHCFIDGKVLKDPGDLDGQGLIVVPITILAP